MSSAEYDELVAIVPRDKLTVDGRWQCEHGECGLSCQYLECRYVARMLEAFNYHKRLATRKRELNGESFPRGCYFDLRFGTEEEIKALADEWLKIKKAFRTAGLKNLS